MNSICAAGTGSFLDQQARRLNLSIEEFGKIALSSKNPPRIAGRCSVFAKTDMIHLQQMATPDYDIVAGLCFAMARNFKSTIGKGKSFNKPIVFQGGVAGNLGMRLAFREVLELKEDELIIPRYYASMGAIGSVLASFENPATKMGFFGLSKLKDYLNDSTSYMKSLEPLETPSVSNKGSFQSTHKTIFADKEKINAFLGIDVGSISTNLVLIDEQHRVIAKRYLMTAGRPIEAIKQGLNEIEREAGEKIAVIGVGTTGSGRYLTGDFVGADLVVNEITAQATASTKINPEVDTIFEIGGQDSKYIRIENGTIVDFEMNKVCAAGTGSFLEEQAEKLGISIKNEFGKLALDAKNPVSAGERCTVFMESDLVHHQQLGSKKEDLVAGLSYSIVYNYLNKVVEKHEIGKNIFFQGGTAFNLGVVAAFENVLKRKITVPPHHDVTGAIGAAILVSQENKNKISNFKGFDLSQRNYNLNTFECQGCPNNCEIKKLVIKGEEPLYYGSRCEKYEIKRHKREFPYPDLFEQREDLFFKNWRQAEEDLPSSAEVLGIPRAMLFFDLFPFWSAFFYSLGYKVVVSSPTNKSLIRKGIETVASETCFPIKTAHGHVLQLLEDGVKNIFLPSIINLRSMSPQVNHSFVCPYVQSLPYTIQASIDFKNWGAKLLKPVIYMGEGKNILKNNLIAFGKTLGIRAKKVEAAFKEAENAQNKFYEQIKMRGKEILSGLEKPALVIVSRPYNCYDKGINLSLSEKIRDIGVLAIPMDFLPLEEQMLIHEWRDMYWKFGQQILAAGEIIKNNHNLFGIYVTNFGCGPDSFISHFFRRKMEGKPYLQIEIDEHSADVGIITRLEAFLDSLKNIKRLKKTYSAVKPSKKSLTGPLEGRTIYIPNMTDHVYVLEAAFHAHDIPARVFPQTDNESVKLGRKLTSGKECYPCVITTGDMLRQINSTDFSPEKAAFFMPSGQGPCRFGQYFRLHRMILDEIGQTQIPILSFMQDEKMYEVLEKVGKDFTKLVWEGLVAVDLLEKRLREIRPYEKVTKETERVYKKALNGICNAIRNRKDIKKVLIETDIEFKKIEMGSYSPKPVIGIVGEIFIRCHSYSNENIVEKIERLGGEVWLPPFTEWILYTNYTSKRKALRIGDYRRYIKNIITDKIQKKDEHALNKTFQDSLRSFPEKSTEEIIELASDYIHPSFEGEAILSIGKAIDFCKRGVSGIINVMPFTCMPGTIVTAILKRVKEKNGNIPTLFMSYDGQQQTNSQTRLEAFVHQVMEYNNLHDR